LYFDEVKDQFLANLTPGFVISNPVRYRQGGTLAPGAENQIVVTDPEIVVTIEFPMRMTGDSVSRAASSRSVALHAT